MVYKPDDKDLIKYILKGDEILNEYSEKYSLFFKNINSFSEVKYTDKVFHKGMELLKLLPNRGEFPLIFKYNEMRGLLEELIKL